MPSLIGIERCSFMYWFIFLVALIAMGLFAYRNYNILRSWETPNEIELKKIESSEGML